MNNYKDQYLQYNEKNIIKALCVNLSNDSYIIEKISDNEAPMNSSFSSWIAQFAKTDMVYFDDLTEYVKNTSLEFLKNHFIDNDSYSFCYRRVYNDEILWVKMEMHKSSNYTKDNQEVILYIINITDTVEIIHNKENLLHYKIKKEKENELLKSLSRIYYTLHYIDLENNTLDEIRSGPTVREYVTAKDHADIQLRESMKNLFVGEYANQAVEFTNLETLDERMGQKNIISLDLLGKNVGWTKISFIAVDYDDEFKLKTVLFATRIIDEEKRKIDNLINISYVDEMTSLYNRRAYDNDLANIRNNKLNPATAVIYLDINGLKRVNDSLGHMAGDELIGDTAKLLSEVFSNFGRVYRIGGDEFAVIIISGQETIDNLIANLKNRLLAHKGKYVNSIYISAGYAISLLYPEADIDKLEKIADDQMYQDKERFYKENNLERR